MLTLWDNQLTDTSGRGGGGGDGDEGGDGGDGGGVITANKKPNSHTIGYF